MTMRRVPNGFALAGAILAFMTALAIADVSPTDPPANISDIMCEPPILFFYVANFGPLDATVGIGGLNQTAPLFGLESDGSDWHTKWVNVTRESPEIEFMFEHERNLQLIKAYFENTPDLVGLRFECPVTRQNFTCTIKFVFNSDMVELTESTPAPSSYLEIIENVGKWLSIDILKNNSGPLADRWEPTCANIANVSDPEHMSVSSQVGNGWFTCNATTPSPTRFWLKVNDSNAVVDMNGTYTKSTEKGWAFINVSTVGNEPSCSAESILGWSVTANRSEPVYELPTPAKLMNVPSSESSKEVYSGQNYDFLVVLIIIILLILAVVYLFFKNQIHVWMIENVLNRFGAYNKTPQPPTHAECRPMI